MKPYIHARLSKHERSLIDQLKMVTGESDSDLVRRGLHLIFKEHLPVKSARDIAGSSAGKFKKGPRDLSTNKKHFDGFGK